jgi:hypothetical protein
LGTRADPDTLSTWTAGVACVPDEFSNRLNGEVPMRV